jgi:cytochrome c2
MICLTALLISVQAAAIPMDSRRGEQFFESQNCVQCHRLKGRGGTTGPDLGRVLDRAYTPAELASAMWNHAPAMWSAMRGRGTAPGNLSEQEAGDLFAAFYAARYFELPGDAARGKRLFTAKSCARCHGISQSPDPRAKPVGGWQSISDPVALVGAMWNHSPAMWSELQAKKIAWPSVNAQELSDLLVYLRTVAPKAEPVFEITAGEAGAKLFESKGCAACHKSARRPLTLTGVAAAMWNHAVFLHLEPPRLDTSEMREVLSYSWAKPFFESSGDAGKGRRIFASRRCAECHSGGGPGPQLPGSASNWSGIAMVSALWRHGPAMLDEMNRKKIAWPVFRAGEMTDLIAHLNSK